jgi:hypothetical protein
MHGARPETTDAVTPAHTFTTFVCIRTRIRARDARCGLPRPNAGRCQSKAERKVLGDDAADAALATAVLAEDQVTSADCVIPAEMAAVQREGDERKVLEAHRTPVGSGHGSGGRPVCLAVTSRRHRRTRGFPVADVVPDCSSPDLP